MTIVQYDSDNPGNNSDHVLRQIAQPVSPDMFGSSQLKLILEKMSADLADQDDGVAIAAPQVNEPWRIFVVARHLITDAASDLVFINPTIKKQSKETTWMDEGCLSVRPYYGEVERSIKVTVRSQDENGDWSVSSGKDLMAQIFQHEIDHLNGILFIDKAKNLRTSNH